MDQVLAVEQGRDKNIKHIRQLLEDRPSFSTKYELQDGLVYRIVGEKLLFFVPAVLESNITRTSHDEMVHVGTDKVYNLITKTYWFPGMRTKIKTHISNCLQCVQYSPNSGKSEGDLHSMPKEKVSFHTLHIDHVGPLPTTSMNEKHIL